MRTLLSFLRKTSRSDFAGSKSALARVHNGIRCINESSRFLILNLVLSDLNVSVRNKRCISTACIKAADSSVWASGKCCGFQVNHLLIFVPSVSSESEMICSPLSCWHKIWGAHYSDFLYKQFTYIQWIVFSWWQRWYCGLESNPALALNAKVVPGELLECSSVVVWTAITVEQPFPDHQHFINLPTTSL